MKRNIKLNLLALLLALVCACSASAAAQSDDNRDQWFKEVREYKHRYLTRELALTREQEQSFYPLYDKMEDDMAKINNETRAMERRIQEEGNVSDLEYDQAIDALLEQKNKEYQIEAEAYGKFKSILSKKQLFQLKGVERQFTREVLKFHHRKNSKGNSNPRK